MKEVKIKKDNLILEPLFGFNNLLMQIVENIKKALIVIIGALLILSFSSFSWEEKKDWKKINNSVNKIYGNADYNFIQIEVNQKNKFSKYYSIQKNDITIAYLITDKAVSKFHLFDYFVLYNTKSEIIKVVILNYREDYGGEICGRNWLKQFEMNNSNSFLEFNNKVDGISGSTISVNSLKTSIFQQTQTLRRIINE